MTTKAVAFDVHGTLARFPSNRVRPIEVQRMLERFDVSISYQAYEAARQAVFFLDGSTRRIEGWGDFLALLFARLDKPVSLDILPDLVRMYEKRDSMVAYPDAVEAVAAVRCAGLVTCTFTTLPQFMVGDAWHDLGPHVDHYFGIGEIGIAKGVRRFYERITERLGVSPGEILCVGDDPLGDCELPRDVGWRVVHLDRQGQCDADSSTFPLIRSLDELARHYRE